jgi:hypothetical protein
MKKLILSALFVLATTAHAEEKVGVKIDDMNTSQDTTISIKKGSNATNTKKWVLTEGEEDITGDKDVTMKKAENNWKTACKEWKAEFKEMNKENKVVSMSCGKMVCSKEGVESTCVSKATHKVKTLSEE